MQGQVKREMIAPEEGAREGICSSSAFLLFLALHRLDDVPPNPTLVAVNHLLVN